MESIINSIINQIQLDKANSPEDLFVYPTPRITIARQKENVSFDYEINENNLFIIALIAALEGRLDDHHPILDSRYYSDIECKNGEIVIKLHELEIGDPRYTGRPDEFPIAIIPCDIVISIVELIIKALLDGSIDYYEFLDYISSFDDESPYVNWIYSIGDTIGEIRTERDNGIKQCCDQCNPHEDFVVSVTRNGNTYYNHEHNPLKIKHYLTFEDLFFDYHYETYPHLVKN